MAAHRTGLSTSMRCAQCWKRAATLAQCTASWHVLNSASTVALGARWDTCKMPRRKSLCTCSAAASAHCRLVGSLQQVPNQTSQPFDKMGSTLTLNSLRMQSKQEMPCGQH